MSPCNPEPTIASTSGGGSGPLSGVRVLDLGSVIMIPWASQIMGDLGAEVISIERLPGDTNRAMGPGPHPEFSGTALNIQRNKRNVSIDISDPRGHAILMRLIATCDVLLTNLRPSSLSRARVTYDEVKAVRPDIIFCQAQGFHSESGRADEPAYDDIIQAASAVPDIYQQLDGSPALIPTIVADKVSALTVAYAVMAALFRRERTGMGQHIEVPMFEAMRAFILVEHGAGAVPEAGRTSAGYQRILTPHRRPQRTSDGWISILPYTSRNYDDIFALTHPDLVGDPRCSTTLSRTENADFLYARLGEAVLTRSTEQWLSLCKRMQIPATAVASLDGLVADLPDEVHPDVGTYKHIPAPAIFDRTRAPRPTPAQRIGQHTRQVLLELGLSDTEVEELVRAGVLTEPGTDA